MTEPHQRQGTAGDASSAATTTEPTTVDTTAPDSEHRATGATRIDLVKPDHRSDDDDAVDLDKPDRSPDTVDDRSTAGDADGDGGAGRRARGRLGRGAALAIGLSVLCLLLLALVIGLGMRAYEARSQEQARKDGLVALRDAARVLFSYEHTTVERDFDAGAAVSTSPFREEYLRTTAPLRQLAKDTQAVVKAEVLRAGVSTVSGDQGLFDVTADRVQGLVYVNQIVSNNKTPGETINQTKLEMSVVKRDGKWRVNAVRILR